MYTEIPPRVALNAFAEHVLWLPTFLLKRPFTEMFDIRKRGGMVSVFVEGEQNDTE